MKLHHVNTLIILILLIPGVLSAQDEKIGDISDGSRTTPVHLIKLIDQDSSVIWLDESPLMPFSTKKTCEACHNYQIISTGCHLWPAHARRWGWRKRRISISGYVLALAGVRRI
jgi:hypothetical protein